MLVWWRFVVFRRSESLGTFGWEELGGGVVIRFWVFGHPVDYHRPLPD